VHDEPFRRHNSIKVYAIADMEKHVGNASSGSLLECRQGPPNPQYLLLDTLLVGAHSLSDLIRGILLRYWRFRYWRRRFVSVVQPDVPVFVYHVAFRMPVLILTIAEYFNELLENRIVAPVTSLGKTCRIVVVTEDVPVVLIVTILRAEHGRTKRAREMLNVVFAVQGGDV
jgi:hypothetical protein